MDLKQLSKIIAFLHYEELRGANTLSGSEQEDLEYLIFSELTQALKVPIHTSPPPKPEYHEWTDTWFGFKCQLCGTRIRTDQLFDFMYTTCSLAFLFNSKSIKTPVKGNMGGPCKCGDLTCSKHLLSCSDCGMLISECKCN